jgi:hypothetical protein
MPVMMLVYEVKCNGKKITSRLSALIFFQASLKSSAVASSLHSFRKSIKKRFLCSCEFIAYYTTLSNTYRAVLALVGLGTGLGLGAPFFFFALAKSSADGGV